MTKENENSSENHELLDTRCMYEEIRNNNVQIIAQFHDCNTSVCIYITQNHPDVQESYDTKHTAKEVCKHTKKL